MAEFGYQKMFSGLTAQELEPTDLNRLATILSGRLNFPGTIFGRVRNTVDAIKNALVGVLASFGLMDTVAIPKPIPAGYTYLGQFLIHDISFAEHTDRHTREDLPFQTIFLEADIQNLKNKRRPFFDLEAIYGHEEPDDPKEISRHELIQDHPLKLPLLKLDFTQVDLAGGLAAQRSYPCDLSRKEGSTMADIVDSRNDEILLLAQTQVVFTKFHNAIVAKLSTSPKYKNDAGDYLTQALFDKARELTIRYYQTIILTDFLPRFVQEEVLIAVLNQANTDTLFYQPKPGNMFIPLEFSLAAFRFGHSMIRENYKLNRLKPTATVGELLTFTGRSNLGGVARSNLLSSWVVNWNFFYDIDGSDFNTANSIDTKLPPNLLELRPKVDSDIDIRANSLAALDLFRGRQFGLPTGQDVAAKILGATIPSAVEIGKLISDRAIENKSPVEKLTPEEIEDLINRLRDLYSDKTPLWVYILAEAEIQARKNAGDAGKLGPVGSRIVAETIIQLLFNSEFSILQQKQWEPGEDFLLKSDGTFGMPEMLKFVQEMGNEHLSLLYPNTDQFDELNPLG